MILTISSPNRATAVKAIGVGGKSQMIWDREVVISAEPEVAAA